MNQSQVMMSRSLFDELPDSRIMELPLTPQTSILQTLQGQVLSYNAVPILLFLYLFLLAVYRAFLHPLAKYPGPWLAKITELYPLYHSIVGDRHLTFWKLHEKHGNIIRYGPNQLSVNSSTGLKAIYGFKANVKKSTWYSVFPPVKGAWSVWTCVDKVIHARKR